MRAPPSSAFGWGLAAIVALALGLRTWDLARRPMHADEANQAVKLGQLLESGRYEFDPADHHGPTLYYAALPIAWLRGEHSLAALTETTVRLVPALAGTLAVALLAALAAPFGRGPALVAAGAMAIAPPAVYYSRYFIQETLLVTFTLAAFVCGLRWWRSGRLSRAIGAGVCVGLMLATKASAPLFVAAAVMALFGTRASRPASSRIGRDAAFAALAALIVAALLYSSFGTHFTGLRDALGTYPRGVQRLAGSATGHEKPWWYYLQLFGWQRVGGLVWQELALGGLAVVGVVTAWWSGSKFHRGVAIYTAALALVLSATPYKTPWHAIHLVPGLALLAAHALRSLRNAGIVVGACAAGFLLNETRHVVFLRAADPRNPFAYVHSAPDVLKFRGLAEAALARSPDGIVRVIADEYWPLPWYFRGVPRVGYWSTPPAECDGALVVVSAALADAVRARLHGNYTETILGLRPGVWCVVFTREP